MLFMKIEATEVKAKLDLLIGSDIDTVIIRQDRCIFMTGTANLIHQSMVK